MHQTLLSEKGGVCYLCHHHFCWRLTVICNSEVHGLNTEVVGFNSFIVCYCAIHRPCDYVVDGAHTSITTTNAQWLTKKFNNKITIQKLIWVCLHFERINCQEITVQDSEFTKIIVFKPILYLIKKSKIKVLTILDSFCTITVVFVKS